jgi:hypothetical protein
VHSSLARGGVGLPLSGADRDRLDRLSVPNTYGGDQSGTEGDKKREEINKISDATALTDWNILCYGFIIPSTHRRDFTQHVYIHGS